jgi:hypothetical protein
MNLKLARGQKGGPLPLFSQKRKKEQKEKKEKKKAETTTGRPGPGAPALTVLGVSASKLLASFSIH